MRSLSRTVLDREVLDLRPPKNRLDPFTPYAFFVEDERAASGRVESVATIFLTNSECPFRCVMCDLWKNTLDAPTPLGAIPVQIDHALSRLPPALHVKLYNSGNFFDPRAVPPEELPAIADRVRGFQTVIVENHPRFCGEACVRFRDILGTDLEIAIGLETAHPEVLARLNKFMTPDDFRRAARFLIGHGIAVRAFILVKPPFLSEAEGVEWAARSVEFALACGASCCSLIPTRSGNGVMQRLEHEGLFAPPGLASLERSLEEGIRLATRGTPSPLHRRVFIDLWDIERDGSCPRCGPPRIERLRQMNLTQSIGAPISCDCEVAA